VTAENVSSIFNFKQEVDNLADSIQQALHLNMQLRQQLNAQIDARNAKLQKQNTTRWVTRIALIIFLFTTLLLFIYYKQRQRMHAQSLKSLAKEEEFKRTMAIERERTRIATDIHDDLGAGLSRIRFLSETVDIKADRQQPIREDLNKIRSYSHEMIEKMGDIVWALNEKNDSLEDLLSYTRAYAVEYLAQHNIQCNVQNRGEETSRYMSGEIRRNVFLTIKEALHNVVRHAHATKVTITMDISDALDISIADNGKGFDPEQVRPFSNGLTNMRKRIADSGGTLELNHSEGTMIRLHVPL
jgi:signal transduction histidine kinase